METTPPRPFNTLVVEHKVALRRREYALEKVIFIGHILFINSLRFKGDSFETLQCIVFIKYYKWSFR